MRPCRPTTAGLLPAWCRLSTFWVITVVSPLPLVELLDGLRAAGFSPAAEDTGGAVLDLSDRGRRTAPRRRGSERAGPPPEPDTAQRTPRAGGDLRSPRGSLAGMRVSGWPERAPPRPQ